MRGVQKFWWLPKTEGQNLAWNQLVTELNEINTKNLRRGLFSGKVWSDLKTNNVFSRNWSSVVSAESIKTGGKFVLSDIKYRVSPAPKWLFCKMKWWSVKFPAISVILNLLERAHEMWINVCHRQLVFWGHLICFLAAGLIHKTLVVASPVQSHEKK